MTVSHRYKSFDGAANPANVGSQQREDDIEDAKLTAFEGGYQAGWEDAIKAQGDNNDRLTADFVQNFEDISFTYHEAYAKLSESMKPILSQLITKLLPEVAQKSLGPQILDQMTALMELESGAKIEIAVAPDKLDVVEQLLIGKVSVPFKVTAESALTGGQVYLRAGQSEREINLDAVLDGVSAAIEAFFHTTETENDNG